MKHVGIQLFAFLVMSSLAWGGSTQWYNIVQLQSEPGLIAGGLAINSAGQIAGGVGNCAAVWGSSGAATVLPLSNGMIANGENWNGAISINTHGQMAGVEHDISVIGTRAVRWDSDGVAHNLGTLNTSDKYASSYGQDINDNGIVVGSSSTDPGGGGGHAVRWNQNGTITDLNTLPGDDRSGAFAINNSGQIVGNSSDHSIPNDQRAVSWSPDGNLAELTLPPGIASSLACDINDLGQVVGAGYVYSGSRAILWNLADQSATVLPTLGGSSAVSRAINNITQIVGESQVSSGEIRGCLWNDGVAYDLHSLVQGANEWQFLQPFGINDAGQIAGEGRLSSGEYRAFLMTPTGEAFNGGSDNGSVVPLPNAAWTGMTLLGGLGLITFVRRRSNIVTVA